MRGNIGVYATVSIVVSLVALGVAWLLVPVAWRGAERWLVLGWGIMATLHVIGGLWLAARFGTPGTGFLVALFGGMLGRLVAAAAGSVGAVLAGETAALAYVTGLAAGLLPLTVLEMAWFLRAARDEQSGGRRA